jgi:CIC family chloride channel protein
MSFGLSAASTRLAALSRQVRTRFAAGEEIRLLFLAAVIGVVTAAAAVAFHELIDLTRNLLYERLDPLLNLYGRCIALLAVIPALGGLLVGVISRYVLRAREGHGIVDVMESVVRSRGYVKPLSAVEKILTAAITIGSGGSAGAEGPIVQIGAAIASGVGQLVKSAKPFMPLLIGAGSAAGISAIFNAPFGGVLFTLEVILQDFSIRTFTPIVLASVVANVTTQAIFRIIHHSNEYRAIFALPSWELSKHTSLNLGQLGNFILLGLLCGVAGVVLIRMMYSAEEQFSRLRLPRVLRPALGGALLGLMGVIYVMIFGWLMLGQRKPINFANYPMPAFFGDGYGVIRQLLDGSFFTRPIHLYQLLLLLGFLCVAKILGTCLTLGSGGSGGIIAPSLFIGSTVGAMLGLILQRAGWHHVQPEVYALVGMGAVLAAVVHAPLASILIVFELTHDDKVILPAMLACIFGTAAARLMYRESIYTLTLRHRGVRLGTMADLTLLRRLCVDDVQLDKAPTVKESEELRTVLTRAALSGVQNFIVVDAHSNYVGVLVMEDIHAALLDRDAIPLLLVSDLARKGIPPVRGGDDLAAVLDALALYNIDRLPVRGVNLKATPDAMISRAALLRRYQQGLSQQR